MSTAPAAANTQLSRFFKSHLSETDPEVFSAIQKEFGRQQHEIELIASENIVSQAVLDAAGSVLTNKYAEGYPGKRYYGGCQYVDIAEQLAIDRAKQLFGCGFANVQPNSGSQANQGVFNALLQPGDTILGLSLAAGGHLTHGAPVNQSGKWFKPVHYMVKPDTHLIDMDEVAKLAREHKPKLIIAGGSAYPRKIDFAAFRKIADEIGAYFLVDMAHVAGLVAAGMYPNPFPHCHVATTTTHKTLRGPRGGMILTNDEDLAKKFNSAIFPGIQGGPLMHVIAAKAVALGEALRPEFRQYQAQVKRNAAVMAATLAKRGLRIVSGGTDCHMFLLDLRAKNVTGKDAEDALGRAHITVNKNAIPDDPQKPTVTSGIRIGSPAMTTRGFGAAQAEQLSSLIADVLEDPAGEATRNRVAGEVKAMCARFPVYVSADR